MNGRKLKYNIKLLFQEGDKHKIENYRPNSSSPALSKIYSKRIKTRIRNSLETNLQWTQEQAGFRKDFSTINHLHAINLIIEKRNEYNKNLQYKFLI